ncbi:MAG: Nif3-like dinuclear metal center hexameric protein [Chloroflexi bacterium]|nr:Nif3-like dinuclear metal center hexameric protein [Chloroflexota bacterium]
MRMGPAVPLFEDIARFLDEVLAPQPDIDDVAGIYIAGPRMVCHMGLALAPSPGLAGWVREREIDALFLHRPWLLSRYILPKGVGVLAYHSVFDRRLTVGYNPHLAAALGMGALTPLRWSNDLVVGMVGTVLPQSWDSVRIRVEEAFRGVEHALPPRHARVERIAVAGVMTEALVRAASAAGAGVYVTGQLRPPAQPAVEQTGIGVIATGHTRAEHWGLRCLAQLLRERWEPLQVLLS